MARKTIRRIEGEQPSMESTNSTMRREKTWRRDTRHHKKSLQKRIKKSNPVQETNGLKFENQRSQ